MHSSLLLATGVAGILRIAGPSWGGTPTPTSLGPWGYVVRRGSSVVLVDVPYHSDGLADEVRRLAPHGVTHLLLTHDDFVQMSQHASWKRAFPDLVRVAHSADCRRGSMEIELSGSGPWEVAGLRIYHTPGHSEGSLFFVSPELAAVFTGDSIGFWSDEPTGFGAHCRFSRQAQAKSLRGFARTAPFSRAILPGHGLPSYVEDEQELLAFFDAAAKGLDGGRSGL